MVARRFTLSLVLGSLSAGCFMTRGGGPADDEGRADGEPQSFSEVPVCQDRAERMQEAMAACCAQGFDWTVRIDTFVAACEDDHLTDLVAFDPAAEAECTAVLAETWNRCVDPVSPWSFEPCRVREPLAELGERCGSGNFDTCREGVCLWSGDGAATCQRPPPLGEPCVASSCGAGAVCDTQGPDDVGTCVSRIPLGASCTDFLGEFDPCVEGSHCAVETGTCRPIVAVGAPCETGDWCQGDSSCVYGVCHAAPSREPALCVEW